MKSTLLSLDARAVRRASIALFGIALLAACDSDRAVSPTPAAAARTPDAAQPVLNPLQKTGAMKLLMVAQNQAPVNAPGGEFKITGPGANPATFTAKDNGPGDADMTLGVILLNGMQPGMYQLCMTVPPGNYGVLAPTCRGAGVIAGSTVGHYWQIRPAAHVFWKVVDYVPNYVGGAVFQLKDSTNTLLSMFTDNSPTDLDPGDGWLDIAIRFDGIYSICGAIQPAGYLFAAGGPTCTSVTVQQGTATAIANTVVTPRYSIRWRVTDGTTDANNQPTLIGPSTFTVTAASNAVKFTVVDNGANDKDPTLGKFAVILSAGGWYSVCETVPPVGHWNAKPSCKHINVTAGVPGEGDYFVSPEAQVPSP